MSPPRPAAVAKALLYARAVQAVGDVVPRGRRPARLTPPVPWRRLSAEERAKRASRRVAFVRLQHLAQRPPLHRTP